MYLKFSALRGKAEREGVRAFYKAISKSAQEPYVSHYRRAYGGYISAQRAKRL